MLHTAAEGGTATEGDREGGRGAGEGDLGVPTDYRQKVGTTSVFFLCVSSARVWRESPEREKLAID